MAVKGIKGKKASNITHDMQGYFAPIYGPFLPTAMLLERIDELSKNNSLLLEQAEKTNEALLNLTKICEELRATNLALEEENRRLKAKSNRNSSNSNLPPSSDFVSRRKPTPKRSMIFTGGKEEKKSGGQKGHKGTTMKTKSVPDKIVDIYPSKCSSCPNFLTCKESNSSIKSTRRVLDVEFRTVQTDYVLRSLCCPNSGIVMEGVFPENVSSPLQYGPGIKAMVTSLSSDGSMGMDKIRFFLNTLFNFSMSDSTVKNILSAGAKKGSDIVTSLKEALAKRHVVHFDETGCKYQGKSGWFHIAADSLTSIFGFNRKRGTEGIKDLGVYEKITGSDQVVVTDFWAPYKKLDEASLKKHAYCLAHLDRELQSLLDTYSNLACAKKMKKLLSYTYKKVQALKAEGKASAPEELIEEISNKYDKIVKAALNKHKAQPHQSGKRGRTKKGEIRALFERFETNKDGVLMFLYDFKVPASNNIAERCAKAIKTKIKVSGCFRSESGPKEFCILKSLIETAKKRGINHLTMLHDLFDGKDISPLFSL